MSRLHVSAAILTGLLATTLCVAQTTPTTDTGRNRVVFEAPPPAAPANARPERPQGPARISGAVMAGMILTRVPLTYPEEAKEKGISGSVVLHAIISKDGIITRLTPVSGNLLLQHAALDCVRQWTYRPYILNGQPTDVDTTIIVSFR